MNKIGIGIIGCGRIGRIHADNLRRMPFAELRAVSDVNADAALEAWAKDRNIPRVTRDSSDIMNDPEIGAVLICSSTDTHVPLIIQAAQAGKHIFCEKPVSMDIRQTAAAVEAANRAGVQLQIGFNRRFDHNFNRVRELVEKGTVGDLQVVKITSRDPGPPPIEYVRVSGGIFMDMMIHDFDMARFLTGSEVEEVYAQGGVLIDPAFAECGDVDTAIATLRFRNGALGVIDCSRKAVYGYDQRVEVFGSKGCVTVANDYPNTAEISSAEGIMRDKPLHFFLERYNGAYVEEIRQFIDGIAGGGPLPVEGGDAYEAERIALAAKLSLRLGRPVKIGEALDLAGSL